MSKRLEKENSDLKSMLNKALSNNAILLSKVAVRKTVAKTIATTAAKTVSKEDEKLLSKSIGMMRDIKAKLTSAEKTNSKVSAAVKTLAKKVTKKIAVKKAPDRLSVLKPLYDQDWEVAREEDRERVSFIVQPQISRI